MFENQIIPLVYEYIVYIDICFNLYTVRVIEIFTDGSDC